MLSYLGRRASFFVSFPDLFDDVGREVIILELRDSALDRYARIKSFGTPGLRCDEIQSFRSFGGKTNGRRHRRTPRIPVFNLLPRQKSVQSLGSRP